MKHLFIGDNGDAHLVEHDGDDSLTAIQAMVNGLVDYTPCLKTFPGLDCWFNDEFSFRADFYLNHVAKYETDKHIQGPVVLNRSNQDGKTISLTDADIAILKENLAISEEIKDIAFIDALFKKDVRVMGIAENV